MSVQPDEITDYLATKLTSTQKRGQGVRQVDRGQIDVGNREIITITQARSNKELANAQIRLAGMALEHDELVTDEEREAWLTDVLDALGLRHEIQADKKKLQPLACWPYTGSERGYNVHLKSYNDPCAVCAREHEKRVAEKYKNMGIEHEGKIG